MGKHPLVGSRSSSGSAAVELRRKTGQGGSVLPVGDRDGPQADGRPPGGLAKVSNAMVAPHKEQFGCGPVRARTAFADDDTLNRTLQDALLRAENALVEIGHQERVQE